jgi:hypothetical protein
LRVKFLQTLAEIVVEPGIGPAIAGRLGGFMMKLQQALCVGESAVDFTDLGGGQIKDFSLDVGGLDLAPLDLRRIFPKSGRLSEPVVFDDQPFELPERRPIQLGVQRRRRILPDADHPLHLAGIHRRKHGHVRVVAENLWVPVPAKLVLLGCGIPIDGLQIGNDEFRHVRPVTRRYRLGREVILQCVVLLESRRRRHIALDRVIERRDVCRALDGGVTSERHDSRARPADVAEQKLQQRAGADYLDAVGMLRPGNGVGERSRPIGT